MIAGTLAAWLEVLERRPYEQQRDTPRIREAFRTLAQTRRDWPVPADFLEAMPRLLVNLAPGPQKRLDNDRTCTHGLKHIGTIFGEMRLTYEPQGEAK